MRLCPGTAISYSMRIVRMAIRRYQEADVSAVCPVAMPGKGRVLSGRQSVKRYADIDYIEMKFCSPGELSFITGKHE